MVEILPYLNIIIKITKSIFMEEGTLDLNIDINSVPVVILDLETSGKYPIDSQICEIAAVKWQGGKEVASYQTLVKPDETMSDFVIKIHNITNEMVADAPKISEVLPEFRKFIEGSICVAHHAPFDLGFLSYDFEACKIDLPKIPAICTSLLAIARIKDSPNHRLQTLMKHFAIDPGAAHRALDDARSCAAVLFKCLETFSANVTLAEVTEAQGSKLLWQNFSMNELRKNKAHKNLIEAVENKVEVDMVYMGGSKPGQFRRVKPISVVRNPLGDFLVANDLKSPKLKRYYISKITKVNL